MGTVSGETNLAQMSQDESMWIESHQTLGRHPKVIRLSRSLKITKAQAIGHLHLLWWWTLDFSPSGDLSKFTDAEISSASEWDENAMSSKAFVSALKECGWLDQSGEIHHWDDYAGKLLRKREIDAERKRASRSYGSPSDIRGTSNGSPQDGAGTVPNRTVPDSTSPNRTEEDEFPIVRCKEFKEAWENWKTHRGEIKKKLTPLAIRQQLKAMTKLGSLKAVAAIEFSIGNGYHGIYEPKDNNGSTHRHKTVSQERNSFIGDGKNQPHGSGGVSAILKRREEKREQEARETPAQDKMAGSNHPS